MKSVNVTHLKVVGMGPMASRTVDVLVVQVAGQRVAFRVSEVEQVVPAALPTSLPGAPAIVEGVLDVRGEALPVIELRRRLGLPSRAVELADCLVLATAAGRRVALRADAALELASVEPAELVPDAVLPGAAYVEGTAAYDGGLLVVLDLARFLSAEEDRDLRSALDGKDDERV